ncbi:MAG TPA: glycoside hydrolase family 15 protein, partial [Rhizobacter sp.]|nr:glycoside hydrolase family 15 protein [Rhizobacter sp.]
LHAKYDTQRGEPVVGDSEWGHLQLDATALYLLMLAQMSASGLRIVVQPDEQAFVQNLVHYLAKAWRTPDYGIWERGHKRNEGVAELNASSLGMSKAALEAIDGFEPLPGQAPPVHVVGDDLAHARDTLQALLPRESESKETDAALLSIVGYPAFAIDDEALDARTRAAVLDKLQGRYGCKRFLRDGHQTLLEDHGRLHYVPGELNEFANIESEWPLFFAYLLVDSAMRGASSEAAQWRGRLDTLMQERNGQRLLPELYLVPADRIEAEREHPHSQARVPNANVPLIWAQSLYVVGALLQEGHVTPADIDPLGRRLSCRAPRQTQVQLAVLAENPLVRARLGALGLQAQTADDLLPVRVRDAAQLEAWLAGLGRSEALGLSGRPSQRLGSLATAQLYTRGGETSLVLPPLFRQRGSYLALDNRLLADEIATELATLQRHWRGEGQPVFTVRITGPMLDAQGADVLIGRLAALGAHAAVRLAQPQSLLSAIRRCRLDGLGEWPDLPTAPPASAQTEALLHWEEAATRPLTTDRAASLAANPDNAALMQQVQRSRNPYEQIEILAVLWRRVGPEHDTGWGTNLRRLVEDLVSRAGLERRWAVVRRAAGLLDLHHDGLEDAVAEIVGRGKRVALGRAYSADAVVTRPLGNAELFDRVRRYAGEDPRGRVLIEETVLLLGMLIKADAALFAGALTLRPWQALLLLTGWLAREHGVTQAEAFDHLFGLSPHAILGRLREVIALEHEMTTNLVRLQSLQGVGEGLASVRVSFPPGNDPTLAPEHGGWLGWREMTGVIARLPADFNERIRFLLQRCTGLVIGDQLDAANRVDSALALADTTPGEHGFALQVEELLSRIHAPEYRQLSIEALLSLSDIARANPGVRVDSPLVLDVLIGTAVRLGWQEADVSGLLYNEQVPQAWAALYASPPHRVANLIMAAVAFLLNTTEPTS